MRQGQRQIRCPKCRFPVREKMRDGSCFPSRRRGETPNRSPFGSCFRYDGHMGEQTLILVKPDGVQRGLIGEILRRFEAKGYTVQALKTVRATDELLARHYAEHVEKPFYPGMAEYMKSGIIVAAIIAGDRVVQAVRTLCGATDPTEAAPGTIRGDLGRSWENGVFNLVHSSDSPQAARREISIWFGDE